MKIVLASLALASAAALGFASKADAAPMAPISTSAAFHGGGYHGGGHHGGGYRSGWTGGVGIGVSTGYGYGGYAPAYVQPSGYWATQYRTVPTTVFAGYDAHNHPVYTTQYVQQAYQVWVPTYYAPTYYAQPRVSVGFGLGYRWR